MSNYRPKFTFCSLLLAAVILATAFAHLPHLTPHPEAVTLPPEVSKETIAPTALFTGIIIITPTQITDYLSNPGMGWQEANTLNSPLLPETVAFRRPQYAWRDQNPQEGVFDWTSVEADLQAAVTQNKQFSFRIYTMRSGAEHKIPQWVLNKGAALLPNGAPDYSNCVYQEWWGNFVEAMRQKYDGNSDIAFIDISGYGNYGEWSYESQTDITANSLDSQARQRLADMFIGGAGTIDCRLANGQTQTVSYNYPGFQSTQLLMPYAGIAQSTYYVSGRRTDVGLREDCLGSASHTDNMLLKIGDVISNTWPYAPIVYEFCSGSTGDQAFVANADTILKQTHGSIVHDNLRGTRSASILTNLLKYAGYRFTLKQISYPFTVDAGQTFELAMTWANVGYAPVYPKMGQDFELHFYLMGADDSVVQDWLINTDLTTWLPANPLPGPAPEQLLNQTLTIPAGLTSGIYPTKVAILDKRTGRFINLAIAGRDSQGRYLVGALIVPGENIRAAYLPTLLHN